MESRNIVIVLGANRSGTSLLVQLLVKMGLGVAKKLVPSNYSNIEGFFEDADIVKVHAELYSCLNALAYLPLPDKWIGSECAKKAKSDLKRVMEKRIEECGGKFGMKDPRISSFLPLWTYIMNELALVPIFILAVRKPGDMVASYMRQYSATSEMAELVWLLRNLEALENTAADCYIAHYDDWFSESERVAQALLCYTGLDQNYNGDLSELLAATVKPNLNRASRDDYEIQNYYVLKLYAALQDCHGADFDRDHLMSVVKECRQAIDGFKGWYQLAHQTNKKLADAQAQLKKANAEAAKVKVLQGRIEALEEKKVQSDQLAAKVQKLQRQLCHLMSLGPV